MSRRFEVQIESRVKIGVLTVDKEVTVSEKDSKDIFLKSLSHKLFPGQEITQGFPVEYDNFDRIPINGAIESLRLTLPDTEDFMKYRFNIVAKERVLVDCLPDSHCWNLIFPDSMAMDLTSPATVNVTIQPDEEDDPETTPSK
jgi:hypothetical protein